MVNDSYFPFDDENKIKYIFPQPWQANWLCWRHTAPYVQWIQWILNRNRIFDHRQMKTADNIPWLFYFITNAGNARVKPRTSSPTRKMRVGQRLRKHNFLIYFIVIFIIILLLFYCFPCSFSALISLVALLTQTTLMVYVDRIRTNKFKNRTVMDTSILLF